MEEIAGTDCGPGRRMILQSGQMVLRSAFHGGTIPSGIRQGSVLEVTGILQRRSRPSPPSYGSHFVSDGDIHMLQAASMVDSRAYRACFRSCSDRNSLWWCYGLL